MFEKVKEIIARQLDVDVENIQMESKLVDDLKADSLDVVELIMDLEQEFDLEIPDEALPKINTVGDIVSYIEERQK
jgi:acyl carrier protein